MSSTVHLRVLGSFRLRVNGREVTSLPKKAQALLSYLALRDGLPVLRETVSDLLWTDRGAKQAWNSLRQTLLVLCKTVPGALLDAGRQLALTLDIVDTDFGAWPRPAIAPLWPRRWRFWKAVCWKISRRCNATSMTG